MARVCLNMIVKNESGIIERCLAAVAPHIDCYVICDTGSTDATISIIKRVFDSKCIPGEIPTTTFRNFEQARNEALDAAKKSSLSFDYILLCDADMELAVSDPDFRNKLTAPAYSLIQRAHSSRLEYENLRLVRRDLPSRYRGVTHEYLDIGTTPRPLLPGVGFIDHASGANRVDKYARDAALLEQGLRDEPRNERYAFYLANTYYDMGDIPRAIEAYVRRTAMGGWAEEIFYSRYRIALCLGRLGREAEMIQTAWETFDRFPHRAEPLHALALHYQGKGLHRLAYHAAELGSRIGKPAGALFVEPDVYDWRLADIMSVSMYYMGRRAEGRELCKRLLEIVPEEHRPRVFQNLQWCEKGV